MKKLLLFIFSVGILASQTSVAKSLQTFKHDSEVVAVAFSPDGSKVLTGSRDDTAKLWNIDTRQQ